MTRCCRTGSMIPACPATPSKTNANSPICARERPASRLTRRDRLRSTRPAMTTINVFPSMIAMTSRSRVQGASATWAGLKNMPTAVKKMPRRTPRRGTTSLKSWCAYGEPLAATPARNAPTARVRPRASAARAEPSTKSKAKRLKSSPPRFWATRSSRRGTRNQTLKPTKARARAMRPIAIPISPRFPEPAASRGTKRRKGTIARSCMSSVATESCPLGESICPSSERSRKTIAVLDIDTQPPRTKAEIHGIPSP